MMTLADLTFLDGKRPGRPPKAGQHWSPAKRQRAYGERLVQAQNNAMIESEAAITTALLTSIKHFGKQIDTNPDHADMARRLAAPVIAELCECW